MMPQDAESRPAKAAPEVIAATDLNLQDDAARTLALQTIRRQQGWPISGPPNHLCPWCGADAGRPCHALVSTRRMRQAPRVRSTLDGCHPSRSAA